MSNEHRVKIQNSNILTALIEHVVNGREMSSTQVTAGLGLLKKCMPDLSSIESQVDVTANVTVKASKEQRDAAVAAALVAES